MLVPKVSPEKIKRREVMLGFQVSPEEIKSREVELGLKVGFVFLHQFVSQRLSFGRCDSVPHNSWDSNCVVH